MSIARSRDYDRYLCSLFAPHEKQQALIALIAFNSEISTVAEVVSEDMIGAIRLTWWQEALDEIYSDKRTRDHEVVKALEEVVHKYDLPRNYFDALIDARALDIDIKQGFGDVDGFMAYLHGTVTNLHQLIALVLDKESAETHKEQIAQQALTYGIIGHLRAIPYHAEQGIVHWPKDVMAMFGINPAAVSNDEAVIRLRAFVNHWLGDLPIDQSYHLPLTLKPLNKMHQLSHIYGKKLAKADGNIAKLPPRIATMPLRLWLG